MLGQTRLLSINWNNGEEESSLLLLVVGVAVEEEKAKARAKASGIRAFHLVVSLCTAGF